MKKIVGILLLSLCLFGQLSAQISNTMYFMDRLPQSTSINPAQTPDCKFYMGGLIVPIFGQMAPAITLGINLPIDYNDVIFHGTGDYADSLITPLHPTADIDDFLKKLRKVNYVSTDFQLSLLTFGFKTGDKGFFSFDLSERMFANVGFPKSLLEFAAKGNDVVRDANFTGLGVNTMYYHQLALGYKRQVSKTLALGLRAKFLIGVANVATTSSKVVLTTAQKSNYLNLEYEYIVKTNLPLQVGVNNEGYVDEVDFSNFDDESVNSILKKYVFLTGNYGAALDFGFSKDINSSLTAFGSIEDLGFISWRKNASKFALYDEDSVKFEGIKISSLNFDNFSNDLNMDSLVANFEEINYEAGSYKTFLPTKVYAGLRYRVAKRISFGALARFEFLPHKINPSVTLTANFKPFKFTAATLSYSYIDGNFNNIGLGFTVHPAIIQWYFVSDNLIGAMLFPANTRSLSFRVGCNLVFGCVQKAKREKHNANASLMGKKRNKSRSVRPSK